jgi:hypothetical protein
MSKQSNKRLRKPGDDTAGQRIVLEPEYLHRVHKLRQAGRLHEAEVVLRSAEPTFEVLHALRLVLGTRALLAAAERDWAHVVFLLEDYRTYTLKQRARCIALSGTEPPPLGQENARLLYVARETMLSSPAAPGPRRQPAITSAPMLVIYAETTPEQQAVHYRAEDTATGIIAHGATPEQALANLRLLL